MSGFVHLHLHSGYSLLDGACRINEIAEAAAREGQSAVALTDHGAMYGAVEFYRACKAAGVKPIIGCEVYVAPKSRFDRDPAAKYNHLVLLVENETGYRNLCRMVSLSFTEGFYSKPRVDYELLSEYSEGLIALSACLGGIVPSLILASDFDGALREAERLRDVFGADSFYLELQDHGMPEQKKVNTISDAPTQALSGFSWLLQCRARRMRSASAARSIISSRRRRWLGCFRHTAGRWRIPSLSRSDAAMTSIFRLPICRAIYPTTAASRAIICAALQCRDLMHESHRAR